LPFQLLIQQDPLPVGITGHGNIMPNYTALDNFQVLTTSTYTLYVNTTTSSSFSVGEAGDRYRFLTPLTTTESTYSSYSYDTAVGWVYFDSNGGSDGLIGTTTVWYPESAEITTVTITSFSSVYSFVSVTNPNYGQLPTDIPSAWNITCTSYFQTFSPGMSGYLSNVSTYQQLQVDGQQHTIYGVGENHVGGPINPTTDSDQTAQFGGFTATFTINYPTSENTTTSSSSSVSSITSWLDGFPYNQVDALTSWNNDRMWRNQYGFYKGESLEPTTSTSYTIEVDSTTTTEVTYDGFDGGVLTYTGGLEYYAVYATALDSISPGQTSSTFVTPYGQLAGNPLYGDSDGNLYYSALTYFLPFVTPYNNYLIATVTYEYPTYTEQSYWVFFDKSGTTSVLDYEFPLPVNSTRNPTVLGIAKYGNDNGWAFLPGKAEIYGDEFGIITDPFLPGYGLIKDALGVSIEGTNFSWTSLSGSSQTTNSSAFKTSNQISRSYFQSTYNQGNNEYVFSMPEWFTGSLEICMSWQGLAGITTFSDSSNSQSSLLVADYPYDPPWGTQTTASTTFTLMPSETISISPKGFWSMPTFTDYRSGFSGIL